MTIKHFLILIGLSSILIIYAEQPKMFNQTIAETNKLIVRRVFEEGINPWKLESFSGLISDQYVGPGGKKGREAFVDPVALLRAAFPDIHYTLEDLVADGDRVAVRWTWQGTHQKPFRDFAPTGKRLNNDGIAIFKLEEGKIVQAWMLTDRLGFLQQVGAISETLGNPPTVTSKQ